MGTHLSDSEMVRLVEIYKDYDCLWNVTHELYKDRESRLKAYKEIIKKLNVPGLTIKDIPNKIKNLRSSYYQEIKRRRNSAVSGAVYKPKIAWFPIADSYLGPFRNEREVFSKRPIKVNKTPKKVKDVQNEVPRIDTTDETFNNKKDDEFDSFGKYIATTLRSMPQEFSIIAKTELQKTISDIQLRIIRKSNINRSTLSPYFASTSSDYEQHQSGCLTPTSDSCLSNIKMEFDTITP